MIGLHSVIMMPVLSRGDAVRNTTGNVPNQFVPEFMRAKSGNWVNKGKPTAQPQPEPLVGDGKRESM
jgi:hypothetical protein